MLALFIACHILYVSSVHPLPVHDSTAYLCKAARITRLFDTQPPLSALAQSLRVEQRFRPPFHPLRAILLNVNSPGIFSRILLSNIALILLIALQLRRLESRISPAIIPGAAIILWLAFPLTIRQSTSFFSELTLTPIVLGLYLMLLNPTPPSARNGIAWGALSGLGCLTKLTFPAFLLPALAWRLLNLPRPVRLPWFTLFIIVTVLIAGPWYGLNCHEILQNFSMNMTVSPDRPCGSALSIRQFIWYPLISPQILSMAGLLLCVTGTAAAWRRRSRPVNLLFITLLSGYIVFSLLSHKEYRHVFALTPFAALLAAAGFTSFSARSLRRVVHLTLIVVACLNITAMYRARFDIGVTPIEQINQSRRFDRILSCLGQEGERKRVAFGSIHMGFCGEAFSVFCEFETGVRRFDTMYYVGYSERWINVMTMADYYICRSDQQTLDPDSPVFAILEKTRQAITGNRSLAPRFTLRCSIPADTPGETWMIEIYERVVPADTAEREEWMRALGDRPESL